MLLFEDKQYLQSYGAESSMETDISSFKIVSLMPIKQLVGLQQVASRVCDVTNPDKTHPGKMQ